MNILFIAPAFQPYCAIAATRPAAFARFLMDRGHTVRVLAAHNTRYESLTQPGIDRSCMSYVDMWHAQDVAAKLVKPVKKLWPAPPAARSVDPSEVSGSAPPKISPMKEALYDSFDYLFNYPDSYMGWIKNASAEGERLIEEERPDILFSSAPPHSANVVAAHLAQRFDLPWVAEYRDLWMDHPYHVPGRIRRFFEERLEQRTVSKASSLVAVSEDACRVMERRFGKDCALSYNGYEADMFPAQTSAEPLDAARLTIVYAGSFYVRTRTPEPLFKALKAMNATSRDVDIRCYSSTGGIVASLAEQYGLEDVVTICAPVPHGQILDIQRQADVLLLMRWDDPREDGVIPGKVFEYIGADRPILSIGRKVGEVADLLTGRPDTVFASDTQEITAALERWIARKQHGQRLPDTQWDKRETFVRSQQFEIVESALQRALS